MDEQSRSPVCVQRPWGTQYRYALNEPCTVALIIVDSGQRLSLQSHEKRAELWITLDEGAIVEIGDKEYRPGVGEEFWIPRGEKHRLGSAGPVVRVLEVAFGQYEQEDIVRYADDYNRPERGE